MGTGSRTRHAPGRSSRAALRWVNLMFMHSPSRLPRTSKERTMRIRNVALPLAILSACAVFETAIGYANSSDAGGWWPVLLAFTLFLYASCSVVFGFIAGDRVLSTSYIAGMVGLFAASQVLMCYLFYALYIDWTRVNAGVTQLTTLETLLRSDWTFFFSPVAFLLAHFLAVRVGWLDRTGHRQPPQQPQPSPPRPNSPHQG
jgi:hypothetical protein